MWRALAVPNFRLLWLSEAVSVLGDQFHYIALAWLVISLTGSGLALGAVLIAVAVPRAILIVPFGVMADRRPARGLMVAAHVARGVIVGAIAALAVTGTASVPALVVLGALFGAADALYMPAQQAFLPRTVEADRLPSANALLQGTLQMASMAGPPLAGIVIAIAGTGTAFAVDAVSFFVAALVILLMGPASSRRLEVPAAGVAAIAGSAQAPAGRSFRAELVAGIRYVAADPAIRTLLLLAMVLNFALNGPAGVGMPWLAQQRFDAGPMGLAAMEAGWAAGALVGIMLAGNVRLQRQGAHGRRGGRRRRPDDGRRRDAGLAAGRRRGARRDGRRDRLREHRRGLVAAGSRPARDGRTGHEHRDAHVVRDHAPVTGALGRPDRPRRDRAVRRSRRADGRSRRCSRSRCGCLRCSTRGPPSLRSARRARPSPSRPRIGSPRPPGRTSAARHPRRASCRGCRR